MPKIKTNRAAAKRFRTTGKGKFRRNKAYASHLLGHKGAKQKRRLRQSGLVDATNEKAVRRMLPHL